jgi:hypothetical protein
MACPPQRIWVLPSARSSESAPKKQAEHIYRDVLDRGEIVFFEVKERCFADETPFFEAAYFLLASGRTFVAACCSSK